ncbi:MAG: MBL fold metallo-hydrolase, partial [Lachnospiraceae bacterium]|nr:MBL fold metallo-hydrolase [Lachnospiraceae bacterium]
LSPGMTELEKFQKILDRELIRTFGKDYLWKRTEEFGELLELMTLYQGADAPGTFTMRQISAGTGDIQKWLGTSNLAEMNEINCASIVVVIRYKGLKLLFMGDSESELWKEQLEPKYDLIKVSHHGSTKPNLAWMESTKSRKLLISTNGGRHRHPEDDFLARVMMGDFEELYFNYDIQRKSAILAMQEKYHFKAEFQKREIVLDCVTGEG